MKLSTKMAVKAGRITPLTTRCFAMLPLVKNRHTVYTKVFSRFRIEWIAVLFTFSTDWYLVCTGTGNILISKPNLALGHKNWLNVTDFKSNMMVAILFSFFIIDWYPVHWFYCIWSMFLVQYGVTEIPKWAFGVKEPVHGVLVSEEGRRYGGTM